MQIQDPKNVPFQDHWLDNTGGMANAIFDLSTLPSDVGIINGIRHLDDDGGHWTWSFFADTLMVHQVTKAKRRYTTIYLDKMIEGYDAMAESATIYRPFPKSSGEIEWRCTRRVEIVKEHHLDHCPMYMRDVVPRLRRMMEARPMAQFPAVQFGGLLYANIFGMMPTRSRKLSERVSPSMVKHYEELVKQIELLNTTQAPFQEHHIHSYTQLMRIILGINCLLDHENHVGPPLEGEDKLHGFRYLKHVEETMKLKLNEEMNRLVKAGYPRDAALPDALYFGRTLEESYAKTLGIHCAINGKDKFSINDADKTNA